MYCPIHSFFALIADHYQVLFINYWNTKRNSGATKALLQIPMVHRARTMRRSGAVVANLWTRCLTTKPMNAKASSSCRKHRLWTKQWKTE